MAKIGLLFSGQGAQSVGMGKSLYDASARARELYDQANAVLGWDLTRVSFEGPESELTLTRACQPALFVVGYVACALITEAAKLPGQPAAAAGLSLGELTALTAAGAMDFPTALRVVAARGRLMQEACDASAGAMASCIGGSATAVEALAKKHDVDLANLNCPGQIVVSGHAQRVAALVEDAKATGAFKMVLPLKVAGAYHSRLMEPARAQFEATLADVPMQPPQLPVFTNVTAEAVTEPSRIKEMLVRQVVSTVRWEHCMRAMAAQGITEFVEFGPGGVLAGLAKRTDRSWKVHTAVEFGDLGL